MSFKFELGQKVRIIESDSTGIVYARTEYADKNQQNYYTLEAIERKNGTSTSGCFNEDELEAVK